MLLTLAATSLASKLKPSKGGGGGKAALTLTDIPRFAREQLDLHGMVLSTSLLVGADRALLQKVVEAADKAGCPCLALIESTPQPVADPDKAGPASERILRVVQAAHWLGCNSVAIPVEAPDDEEAMSDAAEVLRPILRRAEKLELNLCIASGKGLTGKAERVTELLKKVGGFRIGTLPDFDSAAASPEAGAYLRRLVPYASAVLASAHEFAPAGKKGSGGGAGGWSHKPFDLVEYVKTVSMVGFDGALAIDYRGDGDPVEEIAKARDMIRTVIGGGTLIEDEDELDDVVVPEDAEKDDEG
ncbi:MAG: sugar phosphate isomerase/epimerase [Phycisphaerae bacterium]|nr:sugar phosphate isomerase/epimerase [Phycisphaerae bacterium]